MQSPQSQEGIFLAIGLATAIFLLLSISIVWFNSIYQYRKKQHAQEKLALKAAYERDILQSQLEVQNQTLQQIGQELHDNVGQILSVARLNLNLLEEQPTDPETHQYAKSTNELIGKAMADIRALTKSLDGDFVKDFGLEQSLAEELQRIKKTGKFQTELEVLGRRFELGFQTEIVLFRICQEILNNALRHAGANVLKIRLNYAEKGLQLLLSDNGQGFDYEQVINKEITKSGAGLRNIKRRAELLGGTCTFKSQIGKGTEITIEIPAA